MTTLPSREAVRAAGAALAAEATRFSGYGWMRGTSGNLSVVVDRDPLVLAVTASGLDKSELTDRECVLIDASGESLEPGEPPPRY